MRSQRSALFRPVDSRGFALDRVRRAVWFPETRVTSRGAYSSDAAESSVDSVGSSVEASADSSADSTGTL